MEERQHIPARHIPAEGSYPPAAAGLDPVAIPPDAEAEAKDLPTFDEAVSPRTSPRSGIEARDPFYYARQVTSSESFRQKHFSRWTWAMIVIAGIVLGASATMMAAGA
jgi:hypothetical protein